MPAPPKPKTDNKSGPSHLCRDALALLAASCACWIGALDPLPCFQRYCRWLCRGQLCCFLNWYFEASLLLLACLPAVPGWHCSIASSSFFMITLDWGHLLPFTPRHAPRICTANCFPWTFAACCQLKELSRILEGPSLIVFSLLTFLCTTSHQNGSKRHSRGPVAP